MSLDTYRGSVWAFRELMEQAKRDIERGEQQKARQVYDKPARKVTHWQYWRQRFKETA